MSVIPGAILCFAVVNVCDGFTPAGIWTGGRLSMDGPHVEINK